MNTGRYFMNILMQQAYETMENAKEENVIVLDFLPNGYPFDEYFPAEKLCFYLWLWGHFCLQKIQKLAFRFKQAFQVFYFQLFLAYYPGFLARIALKQLLVKNHDFLHQLVDCMLYLDYIIPWQASF